MDDASSLRVAKVLLQEKRFQEAIAIFERIANKGSEDAAEAAYCLGVVHQIGSGVQVSIDKAKKYYLIAQQSGKISIATYRLASIYYSLGELQKAYESFREIAQINPSAAYWAYRILVGNSNLDDDPDASEKYLNSAAEQGHVLAQKIIAVRFIFGKHGVSNIPHGVKLYFKMISSAFRAIKNGEKLKYS
jgi:TPR repeat protein